MNNQVSDTGSVEPLVFLFMETASINNTISMFLSFYFGISEPKNLCLFGNCKRSQETFNLNEEFDGYLLTVCISIFQIN